MLNTVKENIILKIQSEFVNRSDIPESIRKGVNLGLSKDILIIKIPREYEPTRAESQNESFNEMLNIKLRIT